MPHTSRRVPRFASLATRTSATAVSNPSKRKGTEAESAVVTYLQSRGWKHAERRALAGTADTGDVTGIYGVAGVAIVQVKAWKRLAIPEWLRGALKQQEQANAAVGVVIAKPVGVGTTRVGEWHAHLTVKQLCDLLEQAGYR